MENQVLQPKVSVLMTAKNAEQFLIRAIESIINQSLTNWEFIMIDDGSMDGTFDLMKKYAVKEKRIRIFRNEKNMGIAHCRNFLVSLARGEYIVWQDADDISMPRRLEKQAGFMDFRQDVGICGGWLQFFDHSGPFFIRQYAEEDLELRRKIFRYSPVAQPCAIIRKSIIDKHGLRYESKWDGTEDLDMSFKIGQHSQFANIPEVLLWYRVSQASITFRKLKTLERQTLAIRFFYRKNRAYAVKFFDLLYNALQFCTYAYTPAALRIGLFNFLRGKNVL